MPGLVAPRCRMWSVVIPWEGQACHGWWHGADAAFCGAPCHRRSVACDVAWRCAGRRDGGIGRRDGALEAGTAVGRRKGMPMVGTGACRGQEILAPAIDVEFLDDPEELAPPVLGFHRIHRQHLCPRGGETR